MYVRKRMDIDALGVLQTLRRCAWAPRDEAARVELQGTLEGRWRPDGDGLACLSVRSGFDLLLSCVDWPKDSEVIMSAVNMPDMVRVVRGHGYVPVPVDLDIGQMKPPAAEVEAAITSRTRAVVVAHLFGALPRVDDLADLARRHDLLLIEDCAQVYDGPRFTGHAGADVAMFSFGTIKTATCMGGALLTVGDDDLRRAMRSRQAAQPLQTRQEYATRALKMLAFIGLQHPDSFGQFVRLVSALGLDYDLVIRRMTKGFGSQDFFGAIRKQPCAPLLQCMLRRLSDYPVGRIAARGRAAARFFDGLADDVATFGLQAERHNHWIVPIRVGNRAEVIAALREAGYDATAASSTLAVIDPPDGRAGPERARLAMQQLVYLPAYPEAGERACAEMADIVNATALPAEELAWPDERGVGFSAPRSESGALAQTS